VAFGPLRIFAVGDSQPFPDRSKVSAVPPFAAPGSQVQGKEGPQPATPGLKICKSQSQLFRPVAGSSRLISSVWSATLLSFSSA